MNPGKCWQNGEVVNKIFLSNGNTDQSSLTMDDKAIDRRQEPVGKHFHALVRRLLVDCRTWTQANSHSNGLHLSPESQRRTTYFRVNLMQKKHKAKPSHPSIMWLFRRLECQMEVTLSFSVQTHKLEKSRYSGRVRFADSPQRQACQAWLDRRVIVSPTWRKCASVRPCGQISIFPLNGKQRRSHSKDH